MKRLINIFLLLSFLIGYLERGKTNHTFIFLAEVEILKKLKTDPVSFLHPLIIIPFCGQIMLLISALQQKPNRVLTYSGLACLSIIILFLFFIGLARFNFRILLSTIPFIITGILALRIHRRSGAGNDISKAA